MGAFDGRVVVVTGAGRGIGRSMALRFAGEGASVVVSSRTAPELDAVVSAVNDAGGQGHAVVADALTRDGARAPVQAAVDRFGRLDVLVNNVGGRAGRMPDPFADDFDGDADGFELTLILNLTSAWWSSQAALPHLRRSGTGRIISIGSGASRHAAGNVPYTTAKHGLVGLTKQLALLCGTEGITVNCICPGWTNTSLLDWDAVARRSGSTVAEARAAAESESAQRRVLEPEELTGMALLLASEEGAGITGQVINVDGGYRL